MAKHQSISLVLVSPESLAPELPSSFDSRDWLRIEQPGYPEAPDGGFLAWTVQEGKALTLANMNAYFAEYKSWCEEDGSIEVELQVHRSRPDLVYGLSASHGELSAPFSHVGEHQRSETIRAAESFDLESQIVGEVFSAWEGPVLGNLGKTINPPPIIKRLGSVLSWGAKATGVLRIKYSEEHDAYILTIIPRPKGEYEAEKLDTAYQSTVFAVWGGDKVEEHEVKLPNISGNCTAGSSSNSLNQDQGDAGGCFDLIEKYHECTGEIESSELVPVQCPEDDQDA